MKKVLIANIFGIGDVLFTSPIVSNLKKQFPDISVDYLCNARTADMVRLVPGVGDVLIYEKDHYVSLWNKSKTGCLKSLYGLFKDVRGKKYDMVFDFTLSREFGLFFTLAGIPKRAGFDYKRRGTFLTDRIPILGFKGKHVIEYYLDVMKSLGFSSDIKEMSIVPDSRMDEWADIYIGQKGLKGKKFVAIIPGGGASWGRHASRKRWHAEGFARVADELETRGVHTVILGDGSEKPLCDYVASEMLNPPAAIETGLSLGKYVSIISRAGAVLCNDGGPLHIAVALGVKTVSIFGPVDEKVYGPYPINSRHRVIRVSGLPCRPCYDRFKLPECTNEHRCILDIGPEKVAEACLELVKG